MINQSDKIWIVRKLDYDEVINEAAFLTENEAKEYINKVTVKVEDITAIWEDCRKFDRYPDRNVVGYTESERKFLELTKYEPWGFKSINDLKDRFEGYSIEEVPLNWGEEYERIKKVEARLQEMG